MTNRVENREKITTQNFVDLKQNRAEQENNAIELGMMGSIKEQLIEMSTLVYTHLYTYINRHKLYFDHL